METVKEFHHNGRSFKVKMVYDGNEWRLKVFMDGKPLDVDGNISDETVQDGQSAGFGDLRKVIADALEEHIRQH